MAKLANVLSVVLLLCSGCPEQVVVRETPAVCGNGDSL